MKLMNKSIYALLLPLFALALGAQAQEEKIWISGASRAIMYGDDYSTRAENDTTTARKTQGGHAMVDLGANIQPSDKILIQGMVRIRNDYGGFWGSGVTFDVRQLYIKGIIANSVRYQLGDINYKLTPYTFNNAEDLVNKYNGVISGVPYDQVRYDVFYYPDDTWRQQGAAVDFALEFDKYIKEMEFNAFTTRVRATNFDTQDDRLYSGGSVILKQGKHFNVGGQFANLYDFEGTSNNTIYLKNPVVTGTAEFMHQFDLFDLNVSAEAGRSTLEWQGNEDAPVLEDFFYDANVKLNLRETGLSLKAGYRDVGPNFRSAGAQTMQINYNSVPQAYNRIGNDQALRQLSLLDLSRDASLYRTQIREGLMIYDPRYNNATPYGRATPNRRGAEATLNYENADEIWGASLTGEFLTNVVGEGTSALKNYNTVEFGGNVAVDKLVGLQDRHVILSTRLGTQATTRSGDAEYEESDLSSLFGTINLNATIVGDLEFIAEYRFWQTEGNDLIAIRDEYSEIIDFREYTTDYNEQILGAGIQYVFSEKTHLRLMYQSFEWEDAQEASLPYQLDTWTLFFTMKF